MLKVYITDTALFREPACYEEKLNLLDAARKSKIEKCRNEEDCLRGIAAGLLLQKAVCDKGITAAVITEEEGKKPRFKDDGYFFNISHAGNFAVCAFADCEVGVDIEMYSRFCGNKEKNKRIAKRIMTPEEWNLWKEKEEERKLLQIWTRKESFAKLTGKGLGCDFTRIDTMHGAVYQEKEISDTAHLSVCTWEKQPVAELFWMDANMSLRFSEKMVIYNM